MKHWLFIFLLLIPLVSSAEIINDYNNLDTLNMEVKISSEFQLDRLRKDSNIDFIEANVTIFPRDSHNAKVLNLNSNTDAIFIQGEDMLSFRWENPDKNLFKIGLESEIKTNNVLHNINSELKFPIDEINSQYTYPTQYIDINKEIFNQAVEIVKYEDNLFDATFEIARWIESNIKYNLSTLTEDVVQPSSWVLQNKEGVCDELTNLFISMTRSLGIPSRYVTGVAYTNLIGDWGPHAWAEVYFPEIGWVPFDVTYGQFGWIDPTHIKLKTTLDSGDPSIKYIWRGKRVDFNAKEIDIDTSLVSKGEKINNLASLKIIPLLDNVGPGSYVPFEVKIKNNNPNYLPEKIVVTKASDLTERNVKFILLKPGEQNSLFWITQIPRDLEPYTRYFTTLEVEDVFHDKAQYNLSYSLGKEIISLEKAQSLIKTQEKNFIIQNIPSSPFLQIKNFEYNQNPSYKEALEINFILEIVEPAQNVRILINNKEILKLDSIDSTKKVKLNLKGKDFLGNKFKIVVEYEDKNGKSYSLEQSLPMVIKDFPWYIVLLKVLKIID